MICQWLWPVSVPTKSQPTVNTDAENPLAWRGSLNEYIFLGSMRAFAYSVFTILYCWQGYPKEEKKKKKRKEINLTICSVSKKNKRLVTTAALPVSRGDTIFTECSADQQATPDHKTSGTFFFQPLARDKCCCQTPARAAEKGTLALAGTGQELPASSLLPHACSRPPAGFMALGFHPSGPVTLPTIN